MDLFTLLVLFALVAVALGWSIGRGHRRLMRSSTPTLELASDDKEAGNDALLPVEPLRDFDWEKTEPRQFRPFKPIYHITMALQADTPSELIIIDTNYKTRIEERRELMANHAETVMGALPLGHAAVEEVYTYLLSDYLPARYPTMFAVSDDGKIFHNRVTGAVFPCLPPGDDPLAAFRAIGETVEEDMFILRRTEAGDHQAVAFLCCFPAGFDPAAKLGMALKDIHAPVPSYDKIGPSMERFFARAQVGKSVKRLNWSISTDGKLFKPDKGSGHHVYSEKDVQADEEVDIETTSMRVEIQTLTRLPKTQALLFSFKTYMYPVKDIKAEGLGPQFADAIEGLKKGNASGMWLYKGGIRWGKSVCEYLRS